MKSQESRCNTAWLCLITNNTLRPTFYQLLGLAAPSHHIPLNLSEVLHNTEVGS